MSRLEDALDGMDDIDPKDLLDVLEQRDWLSRHDRVDILASIRRLQRLHRAVLKYPYELIGQIGDENPLGLTVKYAGIEGELTDISYLMSINRYYLVIAGRLVSVPPKSKVLVIPKEGSTQ